MTGASDNELQRIPRQSGLVWTRPSGTWHLPGRPRLPAANGTFLSPIRTMIAIGPHQPILPRHPLPCILTLLQLGPSLALHPGRLPKAPPFATPRITRPTQCAPSPPASTCTSVYTAARTPSSRLTTRPFTAGNTTAPTPPSCSADHLI